MMKFYISTLGCRLNQAESQDLEGLLINQGWQKTSEPEKADLIVVNTCVVTQKAERETRKELRFLNRKNPQAKLIAAGCWVDKLNQFGGIKVEDIDNMVSNQGKWIAVSPPRCCCATPRTVKRVMNSRALIKIQTGCDNSCAYCLPTLIRGPSISIPIKNVVTQVKQAVDAGAVEVVLTGQNISQYNDRDKTWADLVEQVLSQTDIQLLRLGSINPTLIERPNINYHSGSGKIVEDLIGLYQSVGRDRLARHLHLSMQSGSDRILKMMNRGYAIEQFGEIVKKLRQGVEGINITSDVIVGFPGETEKNFQETLNFCEEIKLGQIHIFRYSPRKGTFAFKKRNNWGKVSAKIKKARSSKLHKLDQKLRHQFLQSQVGRSAVAKIWDSGDGLTDNYIPIDLNLEQSLAAPVIKKVKLLTKYYPINLVQ